MRWRGSVVAPICAGLLFPLYRKQKYDHPAARLLHRLEAWDLSRQPREALAWNVLVVARKRV
jgi:hypothetical protein